MTFYTYIHTRASDNKPFYVGKGKGRRAHETRGRNDHWKRTVAKHGLKVDIAAEWPTEAEAFEHEKFLIACFRDMKMPLVNQTDGGDGLAGYVLTPEQRELQLARMLGDANPAKTPEARAKLGGENNPMFGLTGDKSPHFGKKRPDQSARVSGASNPMCRADVVAKISGDSNPSKRADVRQKISDSRKGIRVSQEAKDKLRIANLGKKASDETKAKMSLATKGKKKPVVVCPHCNKSGGQGVMTKWHFDNCKAKP